VLTRKERLARNLMLGVSVLGCWVLIQFCLLQLNEPKRSLILILLVLFLTIVEFFPLPVWKGYTSISFPLVGTIFFYNGMAWAILSFAFVSVVVNLVHRRPLRIVFFNPAQLVISLFCAYMARLLLLALFPLHTGSDVLDSIIRMTYLIIPFYLVNNLIVDMILSIRPQVYSFKAWWHKTIQELNSFFISYIYLVLLIMLTHQNGRKIDIFSAFFFFAPLVAIALLSSIIANLKKEKSKLKALFSISTQLNKKIAAPDWLSFLADNLPEFIDVDAWILWKKENGIWRLKWSAGLVNKNAPPADGEVLDQCNGLIVCHNVNKDAGPVGEFFNDEIKSLIYAPLILDKEKIGLFVCGKSRTNSFTEDDVTSAATLANQLAGLIKTRWLFAEQESRLILEERNRIARDIHDGLAQSLAGAILNLETANRKFSRQPEDARRLMFESTEKLRRSLREVRESIYALRPYPTERVGLIPAITAKMEQIKKATGLSISLEKRGSEFMLSPMVEKIIFDIFQESTQNAIKHAAATKIEIMISYQKENVFLKVKDDGKGFSLFKAMIEAQKSPHFGILHMNEAAEKIQASLQVDSKEGSGTEITLTVPKLGIEGGIIHDQAYAGG
jgi:signal transduction histidine kinase